MSESTHARGSIGEFLVLAQLLITVVSGSVANERVFSALEFVKNTRRNALQGDHLEWCARAKVQNVFTLEKFPYEKALAQWRASSVRGRYMA